MLVAQLLATLSRKHLPSLHAGTFKSCPYRLYCLLYDVYTTTLLRLHGALSRVPQLSLLEDDHPQLSNEIP